MECNPFRNIDRDIQEFTKTITAQQANIIAASKSIDEYYVLIEARKRERVRMEELYARLSDLYTKEDLDKVAWILGNMYRSIGLWPPRT